MSICKIEEATRKKTYLMGDVGSCVRDIPARFGQNTLMVIAVQERILRLSFPPVPALADGADFVRLETSLLEDDEESSLAGSVRPARDVRLLGEHRRIGKHFSRLG